ncbi:MAG: aromatic ring-hydroxylating oxygenase subunit alpha [Acidimicrobiia bacterium]
MVPEPTTVGGATAAVGEFLDDAALSERLLDHIASGTTDLANATWREPTENYRNPQRFADEVEVLRRQPVPFCPSASIREPGSYLARVAAGRELVAVRDREGVVRVFKNACRHRGTAIVSGCGSAGTLACPYHGWVYRPDGRLRHVPGTEGFPHLDLNASGLVEVPSVEVGGFVVIDQDGESDLSAFTIPRTPALDTPILLDHSEGTIRANWKVFLESFLEGYHIRSTHRETFFPFQYDNVNAVEHVGLHSRVTFPFRRIEKLRGVEPSDRHLSGLVTRVVHLFPTVVVAELSHHTTIVMIEPIDAETTKTDTFQLVAKARETDASSETSAATKRDLDFVAEGTREDQEMVAAVQRGLDSDVDGHFNFGLFEGAVTHFHRNLTHHLTKLASNQP